MPRKPAPQSFEFPFHITARCTNKDWFAIPMPEVWRIMEEQLYFAAHAFDVRIHSFVLMTNHFHLMISTPSGNLSSCMRYFMTETSRALLRKCRRINQIYGGRNRPTQICSAHHFTNAYKYVYRNPAAAGLCTRVEDYPYSTLRGLLGAQHLLVPLVEDTILFDGNLEQTLAWLNRPSTLEEWDEVRRALRRRTFQLPQRRNGTPSPLETRLL